MMGALRVHPPDPLQRGSLIRFASPCYCAALPPRRFNTFYFASLLRCLNSLLFYCRFDTPLYIVPVL